MRGRNMFLIYVYVVACDFLQLSSGFIFVCWTLWPQLLQWLYDSGGFSVTIFNVISTAAPENKVSPFERTFAKSNVTLFKPSYSSAR